MSKAAGYIVHDNEGIIHGDGNTVNQAWGDAENTFGIAGVTLLDDDADSTEQQGAWTRWSGLKVVPASNALMDELWANGGDDVAWRLVNGVAVTLDEADE